MLTNLDLTDQTPPELTKKAFADRLGVTAGRVSQMIAQGLPVLPNGRVNVEAAEAWVSANVNHRSDASKGASDKLAQVKREREEAQRDLLRLQLAEKEKRLVDRKGVELALFERARAERDAHMAWVSRIAPELATELQVDLSAVFAFLDREMRRHLEDLASTPLQELAPDA